MQADELTVKQLGPCAVDSPLMRAAGGWNFDFIGDERRVLMDITTQPRPDCEGLSFEQAGPRRKIFFDPKNVRAAILTAGGLCPGLNDVIRGIVMELHYWYGVEVVYGIRYGYQGLTRDTQWPPRPLTMDEVEDIQAHGGTILGSSRGRRDSGEMIETMQQLGINMLFTIGGDGTSRAAHELACEIEKRSLPIAVVSIPKTIDNDIQFVYRSFGFATAVEVSKGVLTCAHVEAKGAPHGVSIVKLMGRDSGAIAAHATLASGDVNYCLVPELPFPLEGEDGLLAHLRARLPQRNHAVICVAEGAGQHLIGDSGRRDASGNIKYNDIGLFLRDAIAADFKQHSEEVNIKYFDPGYTIRSTAAVSADSIFCSDLADHAVHAAMAGKTDVVIGYWHGVFTNVPMAAVVGRKRRIDPRGKLWRAVLSATGQPGHWGLKA
ncbi:ATP-dependent 6-phosphofructokinase [bacterium]|nr:ATP-dependent 6-phosphofructokinase [bacterium]